MASSGDSDTAFFIFKYKRDLLVAVFIVPII